MMDDERFLMWRACFAIVKLDGVVTKEEETWAENALFDQPFSDEQKETLRNDLRNENDFDVLYEKLNKPTQRSWILHMVRTLGNIDGDFSSDEKAAFKRVEDKILSSLDISKIEENVKKMEERSYHRSQRREFDEDKPILYKRFLDVRESVDDFFKWIKGE